MHSLEGPAGPPGPGSCDGRATDGPLASQAASVASAGSDPRSTARCRRDQAGRPASSSGSPRRRAASAPGHVVDHRRRPRRPAPRPAHRPAAARRRSSDRRRRGPRPRSSTASTDGTASASISSPSSGPIRSSILARRSRIARPARSRTGGLARTTALAAPTTIDRAGDVAASALDERAGDRCRRPPRPRRQRRRDVDRAPVEAVGSTRAARTSGGRSTAGRPRAGDLGQRADDVVALDLGEMELRRRTSWTGSSGI